MLCVAIASLQNCSPSVLFARIKLIYESKLVSGLIPVFFSASGM